MPNSAKWHSSKTQVLCGFEPNSAISLSQALGQRTAAQCLGSQVAVLVPGGDRSGPVYVATSVGAGRLPLADSTRGGSRDRRFGAAGFSEGGWQAARAWVRGRSGRLFPLPYLRSQNDSER